MSLRRIEHVAISERLLSNKIIAQKTNDTLAIILRKTGCATRIAQYNC